MGERFLGSKFAEISQECSESKYCPIFFRGDLKLNLSCSSCSCWHRGTSHVGMPMMKGLGA